MDFEDRPHHTPAIGWGRILRIHTVILRNICSNLKELVLRQGRHTEFWEDGLSEKSRKNEGRIHDIVRKVVENLPSLRRLRLGEYNRRDVDLHNKVAEEWGESLEWEEVVESRLWKGSGK